MTGRRVQLQAVALAVAVALSMVATGAVFAGMTAAQTTGLSDTGEDADEAGDSVEDTDGDAGGADSVGDDTGNAGDAAGNGGDTSGNAGGPADNARGGASNAGGDAGDSTDSSDGNTGGTADSADGDVGETGSSVADSGDGAEDAGSASDTRGEAAEAAGAAADNPGENAGRNATTGTARPEEAGGRPDVDDAGPSANGRAAEGAGPDMAEVVAQVAQRTPDAAANVEIEDTEPDTPGVTVTPGTGTDTVSAVRLADEELRGTVDIKEYGRPPAAVTDSIANAVLGDSPSNSAANDSGTETNETDGGTTVESTATARLTVVSVANISVFDENGEEASDAAATISMDISRDAVTNPENAVVVHETDDGWEELDTSIESVTNETVTLAAETDGFSLFAVAEIDADDEESAPADVPEKTTSTTPGFGVWITLAALATFGLLSRRLSR